MDAVIEVLKERGQRYGNFWTHAMIAQRLKKVMHGEPGWAGLTYSQQEALDMIQHKIARILNGDPSYVDSWFDIEGYARLVREELTSRSQFEPPDIGPSASA